MSGAPIRFSGASGTLNGLVDHIQQPQPAGALLGKEKVGPFAYRRFFVLRRIVTAQHDNACFRGDAFDRRNELDAIILGECNIEKDDIHRLLFQNGFGLDNRRGLGDLYMVFTRLDHLFKRTAENRRRVENQNG